MGCGLSQRSNCKITSLTSMRKISSKADSYTQLQSMNTKICNDYQNKISEATWLKVLDLLPYNDLKETGKTSKMFNNLSKKHCILVKFFQKRRKSSASASASLPVNFDKRNTDKRNTCYTSFYVLQDNISVSSQ